MTLLKSRRALAAIAGPLSLLLAGIVTPPAEARQAPAPPDLVNQAKGEAALSEAREHMLAHRWTQAIDAYEAALTYLPGNLEAIDGIRRAQTSLEESSTISGVAADIEIQRGRAIAEFDASMAEAERRLAQHDFRGAERAALTAQIRIGQARGLFSEREFSERNERAEALLTRISTDRETAEVEQKVIDRTKAETDRDALLRTGAQQRERLIHENLARIVQLQKELKFEEALQVVDEILFLDETNATARLLRDSIRTLVIYRRFAEMQRQREMGLAYNALDELRGTIPPRPNLSGPGDRSVQGVMTYPEDWANLSLRRAADTGFSESPANRRVANVLAQKQIPADFEGHSFGDVIAFLGTVTGENVYADWKALEFIGVRPDDAVTLQLAEVSAATVIDRVLEQVGDGMDRPEWAIQDGIVTISSEAALRKNTVTVVYDIRDMLFQVPYFGNAPELELATAMAQTTASMTTVNAGASGGLGGGSNRGRGGDGAGGGIFTDPGEEQPRVSRDELVDQIVAVVQDNVDPEGWRDMGGDTGTLMELNGNLIITNTLRNHRQIEGLLAQLREIRALQINVEGRFLAVQTAWFEQIGVDLDLYFNTNNTVRQQQLLADPLGHLSDFFNGDGTLRDPLIYGSLNQTPNTGVPPFINQNSFGTAFGVPVDTNGDGIPDSITYAQTGPVGPPIRATQGWAPIGFVQDSLGLVGTIADLSGFGEAVMAANPALAVGIQFLDDVQVDLLIQATQADRRSVVLTSPRLTFFNGQRAWTAVADQVAFVSALVPIIGDAAAAFQPIPGVVSDGVVLDVEGVISADRRYVTMTVIISVSKIVNIREFETQGAVGGTGQIGGGGTFTATIELPEVEVALVQTTVSVPDKGTVLLGGQRLVEEVEVEAGVPILSKIPFINRFFTNRLTSREEATLLVLIRPEIIIQQENEDILFPGLSDSLGGGASYLR